MARKRYKPEEIVKSCARRTWPSPGGRRWPRPAVASGLRSTPTTAGGVSTAGSRWTRLCSGHSEGCLLTGRQPNSTGNSLKQRVKPYQPCGVAPNVAPAPLH